MSAFTRPLPGCVSPPFRVLSIAVVAWGDENAVPGLMPEMPMAKSYDPPARSGATSSTRLGDPKISTGVVSAGVS